MVTNPLTTFSDFCLTLEQVAELLKAQSTNPRLLVMKMARKGQLRGRKVGREWRFHPNAVSDFLLGKS